MAKRLWTLLGIVLLVGAAAPAAADIVGEGVTVLRCTEGADIKLPKQMTLVQTISDDAFAAHSDVFLFFDAEYEQNGPPTGGKIVVTVLHRKPDGTTRRLGKFQARLDGERRAEGDRYFTMKLQAGDMLQWTVKLKKVPTLLAALDECWEMTLGVAVGEQLE